MVLAVRMTEPCEGCFTYRRQEPEFLCFGVLIILFLLCLSRLSLTADLFRFISVHIIPRGFEGGLGDTLGIGDQGQLTWGS